MQFEKQYYKDSGTSNYKDYNAEKQYSLLASELIKLFDIKKNQYILDFGCATGVLIEEFRKKKYLKCTGTDVSYWAISEGKKKPGLRESLHYYNLNLLNSYFDLVFFFDVFEHIHDQELVNILSLLNTPNLIVKIPVSKKEGEPFALEVSRKDVSHIQCHTKEWWINFFGKFTYRLKKTIHGNEFYDSDGVFAAQFVKDVVCDKQRRKVSSGRRIFSIAAVYVFDQNYGLRDFLEKVASQVDKVWAIFDGVENIEQIDKLNNAHLETLFFDKKVGRSVAFKKIFNETKSIDFDSIILLEYWKAEDIESIPVLLNPIHSRHADVVMGSRFNGHMPAISFSRKLINKFVTGYIRWKYQFACTDAMSRYLALSKYATNQVELGKKDFGCSLKIIKETARRKIKYTEIGIKDHDSSFSFVQKMRALKDLLSVLLFE